MNTKVANKMGTRKAQSVSYLGHRLDYRGFESNQEQSIFLFCKTLRLALGPIQSPTQWVLCPVSGINLLERNVKH
jgi:hypothetical protein